VNDEKRYADGEWSRAKFHSFIKSGLRKMSQRWGPKNKVMRDAKISRGVYLCAGCGLHVPYTVKDEKSSGRKHFVFVDHKDPIISPEVGFTTWDDFIERLFSDSDNLQVLCGDCHSKKTAAERVISNKRVAEQKYGNKQKDFE
jgi:5-methylcytosine-specific restriction endonuclease McrA